MGAFSPFHWVVVLLLGGFGLPVGVPPLPEDPMLANIAPEECVAYVSSAGMATPDAKNGNQTEQLLAEPEVRQMAAEIEQAVRAGLKKTIRQGSLPPGVTSDDLSDAVKLLLTRPLAVYVSSVQMQPSGPVVHGGIAINCGDHAARLKTIVEQLAKVVPPQLIKEIEAGGEKWWSFKTSPDVGLVCGFHGNYLLATVGEGEIEALLKRAAGAPPAWLTKLRQDIPVERLSTVTYVNLKAVKSIALPMAGPQAVAVINAVGLDNVNTLVSVTGLDQKGCITKTLLSIDGEPQGVMRLADVKPLTATDLATIPSDATLALAYRLNPAELFETIQGIVEKVEPRGKEEMLRGIGEMEEHLGLKLQDDILKPLGDTWCVFDSPSEGGGLAGLTLVVSLKDPAVAKATSDKLAGFLQARLAEMQRQFRTQTGNYTRSTMAAYMGSERLETAKFQGHDIHVYTSDPFGPPFAPAWCVSDKELIVALFPQSIKAYLSRPAGTKSLAEVHEVAAALQEGAGPLKLAYADSRRLFDVFYPVLVANSKYATWELQRSGINLSPTMLPSPGSVRRHLLPTVIATRRSKAGIEVTEHRTLPGPSLATTAPVSVALLLPAVQAARPAARRVASINNLKQIGLAMHNYGAVHKTFPPAYIADKNGKPLLSWRVLVLPYLEGGDLTKQFHLDEPWDSEHNKKLINKMPSAFRSPTSTVSGQGKTNYLTVRGEDTIFSGEKPSTFGSIRDGLSNTIMTVEVSDAKAVIWTKPDDFEPDEDNPIKGLVGLQAGGFIAGLADGSVRFINSSVDPKVLKAMFTKAGREPISSQELDR